jgi:hypothetical protein
VRSTNMMTTMTKTRTVTEKDEKMKEFMMLSQDDSYQGDVSKSQYSNIRL